MKTPERFARSPTLLSAGVAALSLTVAVAKPPLAFGDQGAGIVVPAVPPNLEVRAGNQVYLEGHGVGTLDTSGGVAPEASTCAAAEDAGKKALVPYSADYFFYK